MGENNNKSGFVRLKDVCRINMGQSPDSESYNEEGEGIPFFQGNSDFGDRYPTTRKWCSAPTKIAQPKDILISVRAPIGAMNYAKEECCIGRGLAALSPDTEKVSSEFIFWLLKGKHDELNSKGTGSTFKAISRKILEDVQVPDLSIDNQLEISRRLEKIYDLMQLRRDQLTKLDTLIKARFVEQFGDVIRNNKNWKIYLFSEVAESRLGKMLDAKKQTGLYSYPYLANFNVQWFSFNLDNLNQMDFDDKEQKEFELQDGDILVCEGGEIGRCAVWHNQLQHCYFQKALHRVRCNRDVLQPDYLSWWFKFNCDHGGFSAIEGAKATIAHLPGAKLKRLEVAVPPIELQVQFSAFVAQVDKSKVAVQKSLDELQTLFDSLMQEYFG
ncbi:MAG: restriction endonuclease subunit S [Lachnospiraceae bacterium]|nr:restriction endonuclease subunit S [Lachnospiraceae bacterium]